MQLLTLENIAHKQHYPAVLLSCEETLLGPVWVASTNFGICKLTLSLPGEHAFLHWLSTTFPLADFIYDGDRHKPLALSLDQYALGSLETFSLPLHLLGTDFQLRVWQELLAIPYGTTSTYGKLAEKLHSQPRAIGQANARNPIAILVPCHRIIGSGQKLTGYAGGMDFKRSLLNLESTKAAIKYSAPVPRLEN